MSNKLIANQIKRNIFNEDVPTINVKEQKKVSHTTPISVTKTLIDSVNTISDSSFGSDIRFRLPFENIVSVYAVTDVGTQVTNGFYDEVGLSLFEEARLLHSGSTLEEFNYTDAAYEAISRLPSTTQTKILNLAGGTALSTGQVISPMPLMFDRFTNRDATPLDCRNINSPVELVLSLRSLSDLTNSNVASDILNSIKLVVVHTVEDGTDYHDQYHGLTYQSSSPNTVANATDADIEISGLTGEVQELIILNRLVSDLSSNYDWGVFQQDVEKLEVRADGKKLYENHDEFQEDNVYEQLVHHGFDNVTGGSVDNLQRINFSYNQHPNVYAGSLPMDQYNKVTLRINHSAGASCEVSVLARSHVKLEKVNGKWRRHE